MKRVKYVEKTCGTCHNEDCNVKITNKLNLFCKKCEHILYYGHEIGDSNCKIFCTIPGVWQDSDDE